MEFRYARHTQDLESIVTFYQNILGFELFFSFENHNGFNGAFLGKQGLDWHLEFTSSDSTVNHVFDEDDILVFYPKMKSEFDQIIKNIEDSKLERFTSNNPYWNENGIMIKDPDGFNVIICGLKVQP